MSSDVGQTFNFSDCRNETEVESKLIVSFLLPQLGYNPHTWHQEVTFGRIRLDFLVFALNRGSVIVADNAPLHLVIEAKSPKENLDRHAEKLKIYLVKLRSPYGLLTNGKELRVYRRDQESVTLIFQCRGEAIVSELSKIKSLIGREEMLPPPLPPPRSANPKLSPTLPERSVIPPRLLPEKLPERSPVLANRSVDPQVIQSQEKSSMKTIAVYHNKGGVGKTTVSVNLAAAFANQGKRVLLIDMDSQANSTFATGLIKFQFEEDDDLKNSNVSHLLLSGEKGQIPELVRKSNGFNDPEIDVIPSHINILDVQEKLNLIAVSKTRIFKKLEVVQDEYDIVIMDTPPSRDLYAQIPIIAADYLIIPSDLKPFANQGLPNVKNFVQEINEFRRSIQRHELKILGVLPSKIGTNAKFLQYTFPKQIEALEKYQLPIFDTTIHEKTALSACANQSITLGNLDIPEPQSVFKYDKDPSAQESAKQFKDLAKEVLKKMDI